MVHIELLAHHDVAPAQEALIGIDPGGAALLAVEPGHVQLHPQGEGHVPRDAVLHREDVAQLARIGLRPQMGPVFGTDQLCGDAQLTPVAAYAAFQQIRHVQRTADRTQVVVPAPERGTGRATHHAQGGRLRQLVSDLLGQAIGEIALVTGLREVDERQHRQRRLRLRHEDSARRGGPGGSAHLPRDGTDDQ